MRLLSLTTALLQRRARRVAGAALCALGLSYAQIGGAVLVTTIGDPASLSANEVSGSVSATAEVTATLTTHNEASLSFNLPEVSLDQSASSNLTLTLENTGANDLDNGELSFSLPADVVANFPANPAYTAAQQLDGSWLITLNNPLTPGQSLDIDVQLSLQAGATPSVSSIDVEFSANSAAIASDSITTRILSAATGLFLTNEVNREVVSRDEAVVYSLSASNLFASNIDNVVITDVLPPGLRFMSGTAKLDNNSITDPAISADGRTLIFPVGTLTPAQTARIEYLAYVTAAAPVGKLLSPANASGTGASSNDASASIIVKVDPINVDTHVVGRAVLGACELERETLGMVNARLHSELEGQSVRYSLQLNSADTLSMQNNRVIVELPTALDFVPDSAQFNNSAINDPRADKTRLVFDLGDLSAGGNHSLSFLAQPKRDHYGLFETQLYAEYNVPGHGPQKTESLRNTYQVLQNDEQVRRFSYWPRFARLAAELKPGDIENINELISKLKDETIRHIYVIGHADARDVAPQNKKIFASNQLLSEARAQATAEYLQQLLQLSDEQITAIGKGNQELLIEERSASAHAINRRVELIIEVVDKQNFDRTHIVLGDDATASSSALGSQQTLSHSGIDYSAAGVQGIRLIMEDGRYVETDQQGRYHFEALKPGTHVVQIDPDSIPEGMEPYLCESNTRFARNPSSRFVDITPGLIWRANFHLRKTEADEVDASLQLRSDVDGELLRYRISGNNDNNEATLVVALPGELSNEIAALTINGQTATAQSGLPNLRLALPAMAQDFLVEIIVKPHTDIEGDFKTQAWLEFAGGKTASVDNIASVLSEAHRSERYDFRPRFQVSQASLTAADQVTIKDITFLLRNKQIERIEVIGHSDASPLSERTLKRYKNNQELSEARARTVAEFIARELGVSEDKVSIIGKGDSEPVADNNTAEGRALNRRVELFVYTQEQTSTGGLRITKPESITLQQSIKLQPTALSETPSAAQTASEQQDGILNIANGQRIAEQSTSIRVQLDSRLKLELSIDGQIIADDRLGFQAVDRDSGKTLYTFFGVDLGEPGQHSLHLRGIGPFGNSRFEQQINYQRTGAVAQIKVLQTDGNIADGKTPLTAKLQLLDAKGDIVHTSLGLQVVSGQLQPYTSEPETALPNLTGGNTLLQVNNDGLVRFAPVDKAGLYRVKLQYNDVETELKLYVKPHYRDWVMVGLAEGTVGYNDLSGNMQELEASELEDEFYDGGRLAFYAKGKVLGKYLLTVAFDSGKERQADERLQQLINPDDYYTLYGDNTEQQFDAASREKLYLRLDADRFYALFGDFNTELTVTELSRYSRSFTGARAVYESDKASLNAFAAETTESYQRDEIRGNGTSGLYQLSRSNIVVNSEKISIQVRDRFHSERILSERQLSRFIDYNLDFQDGSLFFKEPIASHAEGFNPVYIVAEYESRNLDDEDIVAGGRAALKFNEEQVEVGVSAIHEGISGAEGDLAGIDARIAIGERTEVRAEIASSSVDALSGEREGDAYLAEVTRDGQGVDVNAYIREQEAGFGLGQQANSESGMRKLGARTVVELTEQLSLKAEISHEDNLESDANRDVAQADLQYQREIWEVHGGAAIAEDEDSSGRKHKAELLKLGASQKLFDKKLKLRADSEWQINQHDANVDYPTRHIVGADYALFSNLDIYTEHELAESDAIETRANRAGLRARPWANATVNSALERRTGEFDERTFAVFGLTQTVPLNQHWKASFGYDESRTLEQASYTPVNPNAPLASGSLTAETDDFWAASAGLGYQSKLYLFESRIEYRDTRSESKTGLFTSWKRDLLNGVGHALRLQLFTTDPDQGRDEIDAELRYSTVVRPVGGQWFWFNRTELKYLETVGVAAGSETRKFIENLAINYLPSHRWQLALHLGYKLTQIETGSSDFDSDTWLLGSETRYDLSPRWDIGAHYHWLNTPELGLSQESYGLSTGFDLAKNLWLSVGYNWQGYDDDDFSLNGYTAEGPYLKLRYKFDQNTFKLRDK